MMPTDKKMIEKNLDLIFEFEKYVLQHPDVAKQIPRNAIVSLGIEGDASFNRWSRRLAERHSNGKEKAILLVNIKKMRPAVSRIQKLRVERAA